MSEFPVDIIFQDEDVVIVNKPAWILVHRYKEETNDKVNLLKLVRNKIDKYLYPIHRLDRQTSGVLLYGLTKEFTRAIQEIWHTEKIKKHYLAVVKGHFLESGVFDFQLSDKNKIKKDAKTAYRPLELFTDATLVEIEIFTGRTHQIRRHFARRVQAVIGDRRYGKKKYNDHYRDKYNLQRMFLHAHKFEMEHPTSGNTMTITAPLTNDLQSVLKGLEQEHIKTIQKNDFYPILKNLQVEHDKSI